MPQEIGPRSGSASGRRRIVLLWIAAVVITLLAAVYQRVVGPTSPMRGKATVGATTFRYKLIRSHGSAEDHRVSLPLPDTSVGGFLLHRRYKTDDPWSWQPMTIEDDHLTGSLPHQPPGGKVLYRVYLDPHPDEHPQFTHLRPDEVAAAVRGKVPVPENGPVLLRFRGSVPALALWPHVVFIFLAMLWSNRAGLEALRGQPSLRRLTLYSLILMVLGGLVFGPAVQWFAFGEAWTGFPMGHDLTDNKTLIAALGWLAALVAVLRRARGARWWVLGAALLTLIIFSIPHSVLGTELDYGTLSATGGAAQP